MPLMPLSTIASPLANTPEAISELTWLTLAAAVRHKGKALCTDRSTSPSDRLPEVASIRLSVTLRVSSPSPKTLSPSTKAEVLLASTVTAPATCTKGAAATGASWRTRFRSTPKL